MNKEERTLQEYKEEIFDRIDENTKLEWLYELSKKCCYYEEIIDKAIEVIENLDKEDINVWVENKYWVYVLDILKGEEK